MTEPLSDKIMQLIGPAAELYHRLLIIAAPKGSGKTSAIQEVHAKTGAQIINVNLELSKMMLDLSERQRSLQLPRLLQEIVRKAGQDMILLDNTEILFDVTLKQDPLKLLQGLARNNTIVAAWNGKIENGCLLYAQHDHVEYKKYPISGFLVVTAGEGA